MSKELLSTKLMSATHTICTLFQFPLNDAECQLPIEYEIDKLKKLYCQGTICNRSSTSENQTVELYKVIDSAWSGRLDMVGDLRLSDIKWASSSTIGKRNHKTFLEKVCDAGLDQMNEEAIRAEAFLDLFLTNSPIFVTRTRVISELNNHDIVSSDSTLRPGRVKIPPHTVYVWVSATLSKLKFDVHGFTRKLLEEDSASKSVKETWSHIQKVLLNAQETHIPKKQVLYQIFRPWWTA